MNKWLYGCGMPFVSALLLCTVVGIGDGDTLTARCNEGQDRQGRTLKIRLAEIDAPEHHQAFGSRARDHLSLLCHNQRAEVRPVSANRGVDRHGRTVAHVACNGIDANTEQVRAGMAWAFDRYVIDPSLYRLQREARDAKRGLWSDSAAIPPWEWRKNPR
jgi:endonuclease YncB( thermonuclease family)